MAVSRPKRCSNCGAANPAEAGACLICGYPLQKQRSSISSTSPQSTLGSLPLYEAVEGEDDLSVQGMGGISISGFIVFLFFLFLITGVVGVLLVAFLNGSDETATSRASSSQTPVLVDGSITPFATVIRFPTNTRAPLVVYPTITPVPVTDTATPTQPACIQTAQQGDSVYAMAGRCGHIHFSAVQAVLDANPALNGCAECLKEGQVLEIPWPTPTPDNSGSYLLPTFSTVAADGMAMNLSAPIATAATEVGMNTFGTPDSIATLYTEPTLRPDLMWHRVSEGETLISIASQYNANAKVLSDLNPEINFRQCDFSMTYGGQNCNVIFYIGQRVRVPAPPPTATLPSTPTGSETPTPTATPTFNVPLVFSPVDGAFFDANTLVTLRWSSTGTLGPNEVYLITAKNLDTETVMTAQTLELSFILPEEWQPRRDRVTFEWMVAIATLNESGTVISTREQTVPRRFVWQGK